MTTYLQATQDSGKRFYQDYYQQGRIQMINLLKFRALADYSENEDIRPLNSLSGEEAYKLYMKYTMPELEKAGGKIIYFGRCGHFLIGPDAQKWDAILIVEHVSVKEFMGFAQNKDYLKTMGHRTAALEDSRLLPSTEQGL